jgi:RimJ/RimL family protein N-acetyltransferase
MLQDLSLPKLREDRPGVVATERLTLRRPTLADVKTIARLANDRRIAENLRRLPHPYSVEDAIAFVRGGAGFDGETAFLIDHDGETVGVVGLNSANPGAAELGYWLGVEHWARGFATEAARAAIDFFFEEFADDHLFASARVTNPASRNVLEKCGFQWTGVQLHRFNALGCSTPVDCFRLSRGVWSSLKSWSSARRIR